MNGGTWGYALRQKQAGVGISVMKPFAGGQLLDALQSPFCRALTRCWHPFERISSLSKGCRARCSYQQSSAAAAVTGRASRNRCQRFITARAMDWAMRASTPSETAKLRGQVETRYNECSSVIRPIRAWLEERGARRLRLLRHRPRHGRGRIVMLLYVFGQSDESPRDLRGREAPCGIRSTPGSSPRSSGGR